MGLVSSEALRREEREQNQKRPLRGDQRRAGGFAKHGARVVHQRARHRVELTEKRGHGVQRARVHPLGHGRDGIGGGVAVKRRGFFFSREPIAAAAAAVVPAGPAAASRAAAPRLGAGARRVAVVLDALRFLRRGRQSRCELDELSVGARRRAPHGLRGVGFVLSDGFAQTARPNAFRDDVVRVRRRRKTRRFFCVIVPSPSFVLLLDRVDLVERVPQLGRALVSRKPRRGDGGSLFCGGETFIRGARLRARGFRATAHERRGGFRVFFPRGVRDALRRLPSQLGFLHVRQTLGFGKARSARSQRAFPGIVKSLLVGFAALQGGGLDGVRARLRLRLGERELVLRRGEARGVLGGGARARGNLRRAQSGGAGGFRLRSSSVQQKLVGHQKSLVLLLGDGRGVVRGARGGARAFEVSLDGRAPRRLGRLGVTRGVLAGRGRRGSALAARASRARILVALGAQDTQADGPRTVGV